MAIVVPILLSVTGAATAIATATGIVGLTGSMVSAVVGLAFQVTGVNDKINKAASKVFGEDLVKVANIAGAVYGAVNGGFDFGGGADAASAAADISSVDYVNSWDAASDAFSAANAAPGANLVSDGMGGIYHAPGTPGAVLDGLRQNGLSNANEYVRDGGMNTIELDPSSAPPPPLLEKAALDRTDALGANSAPVRFNLAEQAGVVGQDSGAAAPVAGPATRAPGGQHLKTTLSAPPPVSATAPVAGSFFDRLGQFAKSDKGMGLLVQGVGTGLTTAANARAKEKELAFLKEKYRSVPTIQLA